MASRHSRLSRHARLYWARKAALFAKLGNSCSACHSRYRLEVDHMDGRAWAPRKVSSHTRITRYERELAAGVRLRLLCQECNGRDGFQRRATYPRRRRDWQAAA